MIEQDPKIKPVQPEVTPPVVRPRIPNIDDLIAQKEDEEMRGWDYNPCDDPEDLDTYMEQYSND